MYCFNCKVFISQENGLSNYKIGHHFLLISCIRDIAWEEFWKEFDSKRINFFFKLESEKRTNWEIKINCSLSFIQVNVFILKYIALEITRNTAN